MKNKLPLSPHLQIYKPQITSVLSITHRITGFCLSLTLPLYLGWLGCLYIGEPTYSLFINICSHPISKIIFILHKIGKIKKLLKSHNHLFFQKFLPGVSKGDKRVFYN